MLMNIFKNNTLKKSLVLFGALFLCVMSGACLTMAMYNQKKAPLNEEISGFLVTENGQQIVFIGKHSHYIFPLPDDLKQILAWSGHAQLDAKPSNFVISRGNTIKGTYTLTLQNGEVLTLDDQSFLRSHGFREEIHHAEMKRIFLDANQLLQSKQRLPDDYDYQRYTYLGHLTQGTVYDAGKFELPQLQSFKTPYQLFITYDYASVGQVVGRTLLTPITVAADGVSVVIGGVVLLPIFLVAEGSSHH
jgi:hypothetical protein